MNKITKIFYTSIFWISRFITISIFGTCFFAVLNARYMWSESFFPKLILSSFYFSYFIQKLNIIKTNCAMFCEPDSKYKELCYKLFCINSQTINILIFSFLLIILIYYITNRIINNKKILAINIEIFSIYLFIYLFTKTFNYLLLAIISPILFMIIYLINLYLPFQKVIMLFPIIGELFCINTIISFITKKRHEKIFILIISILLSNIIYMFLPYYNNLQKYKIKEDNIYNITVDNNNDRFLISSHPVLIFGNKKELEFNTNINSYQDIQINWTKQEMYIYDIEAGLFYIIDINTKETKFKFNILELITSNNDSEHDEKLYNDTFKFQMLKLVSSRLMFNDKKNLLLIVLESFYAILVDLENYKIIKVYDTLSPNDSIIYNKCRNSFILTYFQMQKEIQEIKTTNDKAINIPLESEQGYVEFSEQNKEIYIAFHQQGRIAVYDAETMKLKRKIKSNFTVKDITYDEDLNILIAPAYFTGYIDIFLMDGRDKLILRKFVGYELREARFDTKKENLYICSRNGLYKVPINIKDLIKKYSKGTKENSNEKDL